MVPLQKSVYRNLYPAREAGLAKEVEVSAGEFRRLLEGGELPESLEPSEESVRAMLLAHEIVSVSLGSSVSGRVLIDDLILSNGVTLHLGVSPHGAVVYRMTRDLREGE